LRRNCAACSASASCSALRAALAPYGVKVQPAGGTFDVGSFTLKTKLIADGADPLRADWDAYCTLYGLLPGDYGRTITVDGRPFKLVGIAPRRAKFPFIGEENGKRYKLQEREVVAAVLMKRNAAEGAQS
jgi:hypothetical protein